MDKQQDSPESGSLQIILNKQLATDSSQTSSNITCDSHGVVVMPATIGSILPSCTWKVDQTFFLGRNTCSKIIRNFFFYDPERRIPSNISVYYCIDIKMLALSSCITIVKQESVISHSTLPHWSAWVDLICFLVNTHASRLWVSSISCAGYC